jgi:O-succinylbenzoate synthase
VSRFLHPQSAGRVSVRSLMTNAQDLLEAGRLYAGGARSFKVKVGNDPLKDAAAIDTLARETGPEVSICADANRRWTFEEAACFAKALKDARLEYFEDPCSEWAGLERLSCETGIPVALDEGIDLAVLVRDGMVPGASLVILRPTVQGALFQTLDTIQWAARQGVRVVLSSSYESGVGLGMLASLAVCAVPVMPAGLDTLKFFDGDSTGEDPDVFQPVRAVDVLPLSLAALNREYLTEVRL